MTDCLLACMATLQNDDGKISYEEFAHMMNAGAAVGEKEKSKSKIFQAGRRASIKGAVV